MSDRRSIARQGGAARRPSGLNSQFSILNSFAKRWLDLLLVLAFLTFVVPILLIFVTSFKPDAEIARFESILPQNPAAGWRENYGYLLTSGEAPILRWLFNSLFISTSVTLLVLTVDSMAAFALSRLELPGRKLIFSLIIATLMVPGQILLVPVYLILNRLEWLDTPLALIVPAGAGAFGVFLLWSFFQAVPRELEEAAAIDGCGKWRIYWNIMLPLARPALATLGIFTFIGSWNDFLGPLVFLDTVTQWTLPVGVAQFSTSYYTEYGLILAACAICTLPVIVVFLLLHRHIIEGISLGGLKG
jgi:multiple sugar transport system permease protein